MSILLLSNSPESGSSKKIIEAGKKLGVEVWAAKPIDFYFQNSDKIGYDKLYYEGERVYAKDIDVVIPRLGGAMQYGAALLRHINKCMGVPSVTSAQSLLNATNKLLTTQILSSNKVRIPATTFFYNGHDYAQLIETVGGYPCVAKALHGSQGKTVFLLRDKLSASMFFRATGNAPALLQQFIETAKTDEAKSDLRIWVIGGSVVTAMRRYSLDDDFRANASISGRAEKAELTEAQKQLAIDAAAALNLEIAGVDIFTDYNTGIDYVVEVNGCPGLKYISEATKVDLGKLIVHYAMGRMDKTKKTESNNYANYVNKLWHKARNSTTRYM